jgi:BolA protein
MNISADQLELALQEKLQPFALDIVDESAAHAGHSGSDGTGQGTHFRVRIGTLAFVGLTRVARHRLVYDALQQFVDQGLHALAIEIVEPPV